MASSARDHSRQGDAHVLTMDPKRFTPTLHASLVSEILTLRRELEIKHRFIETLETNYDSVKIENEELTDQLAKSSQVSKSAEKKLKALEEGTSAAVEDLVRERDDANQARMDLRSKLDSLAKRARKQEEDTVQAHAWWETEKQSWETERRQLERRVHVTEGRLRAVVEEMNTHQPSIDKENHGVESDVDNSAFKDSGIGNESDTGSMPS